MILHIVKKEQKSFSKQKNPPRLARDNFLRIHENENPLCLSILKQHYYRQIFVDNCVL